MPHPSIDDWTRVDGSRNAAPVVNFYRYLWGVCSFMSTRTAEPQGALSFRYVPYMTCDAMLSDAPLWVVHSGARRNGYRGRRSEEHTSELQSRQYLVCRLLLEKNNEAVRRLPGGGAERGRLDR